MSKIFKPSFNLAMVPNGLVAELQYRTDGLGGLAFGKQLEDLARSSAATNSSLFFTHVMAQAMTSASRMD